MSGEHIDYTVSLSSWDAKAFDEINTNLVAIIELLQQVNEKLDQAEAKLKGTT